MARPSYKHYTGNIDTGRKFRLTRDKGPINGDISPCNEPAKTTPTCYCYKLCFTYTKMWHLSVLSFSTILPPNELKTCYKQNKYEHYIYNIHVNKTDHHDITEILFKVALNTIPPTK
jgi:hypothetical protein